MHAILLPPEELDALASKGARDLHEDLLRGWRVKSVLAALRQRAIAQFYEQARPLHNEALGQLVGVVDEFTYGDKISEFGRNVWRDPHFRREFFRDNPQCNIRSKSHHIRVMIDGWRDTGKRIPETGKILSAGVCSERRAA